MFEDFQPQQPLPVVRQNPETGKRELVHLRFGLIPSWTDEVAIGSRFPFARAETVATKRAFGDAFRCRRCLVVVGSFSPGGRKGRSQVGSKDGNPFGIAGLWECWQQGDRQFESCAVITVEANDLVRPFNDRMPVIIAPEDYDVWLDPEFADLDLLQRLLRPFPSDQMVMAEETSAGNRESLF